MFRNRPVYSLLSFALSDWCNMILMFCTPAGSGWVAKSQTTHTGWHWHGGKTLLSGMLAHCGPAMYSLPMLYPRLHFTPSVVHVHPIIHHTPNVKLITARGHHLAYTTHKGNTLSIRGVRESALAVDAAHANSHGVIIGLNKGSSNFQAYRNHHNQHVRSWKAIWCCCCCCQHHHVSPGLTNRMNPLTISV